MYIHIHQNKNISLAGTGAQPIGNDWARQDWDELFKYWLLRCGLTWQSPNKVEMFQWLFSGIIVSGTCQKIPVLFLPSMQEADMKNLNWNLSPRAERDKNMAKSAHNSLLVLIPEKRIQAWKWWEELTQNKNISLAAYWKWLGETGLGWIVQALTFALPPDLTKSQ